MRMGRMRKRLYKSMAWMMTTMSLLSYAERFGGGVIDVRAKGDTVTEYSEDSEENNCILSMGVDHSAVVKSDGSLWMWGSNQNGALGIGDESVENSNKPIHIMDHVKSVSAGQGTMAITMDDSLWVWGNVAVRDLSYADWQKPNKIMDNVKSVSAGCQSHVHAVIKKDGSLWMWGDGSSGALGDGTNNYYSEPIKIMDDVQSVSSGGAQEYGWSAAIKTDGSLWMWGNNTYGQLGDGTRESSNIPIKIMDDVKAVSLGERHSAAIKKDGSLWMWGMAEYSPLVFDSSTYMKTPTHVMDNVKDISLAGSTATSAVITMDDVLWIWEEGIVVNGKTVRPTKVMDKVSAISLGDSTHAAVKTDGSLWTWGRNWNGQLGNGTTWEEQKEVSEPIQIMPAGSIAVTSSSGPNFEMTTEIQDKQRIQVLDAKGEPIAGVAVTRPNISGITDNYGYVSLLKIREGEPIVISKAGYITLNTEFHKSKTGCTTYTLSDNLAGVIMTLDGEETDVLTKEATINRYDNTAKQFSIKCLFGEGEYIIGGLYSGKKFIAGMEDGVFKNLRISDFEEGETVYLKLWEKETDSRYVKKKLGIQVIDQSLDLGKFSIGEDLEIEFPESFPIVGGKKFKLDLKDAPIEGEITSDGKMQFGINATEVIKGSKNWFATLKNLNKNNVGEILDKTDSVDHEKGKKTDIDAGIKLVGYLEGNIKNKDYISGKLFVEISAEAAWEQQYAVGPVPVVVEISISGKLNADGTITFRADSGFSGSANIGGKVEVGLYGGIGIKDVISVGVYGEAGIGFNYNILPEDIRGLEKLYVEGEVGVRAKYWNLFLRSEDEASLSIIDGTYYLIPKEANDSKSNGFQIDNDAVYAQLGRSYLNTDGTMAAWIQNNRVNADGSLGETILQNAACLDIIPQVVRMGDTVMLFYLTDAGAGRDAADRSMLVYSLWNNAGGTWSEPKAVLDDGTADFAPDLYTDGREIYAVWQNAREHLAGLTLNEIADRLILHTAVYDAEQDKFVDLGTVESENDLFQQNPQIVADDNGVSVYWYENESDNVLGLTGTNKIYQAVLQDTDDVANKASETSIEETEEKVTDTEDYSEQEKPDISAEEDEMDASDVQFNTSFMKYVDSGVVNTHTGQDDAMASEGNNAPIEGEDEVLDETGESETDDEETDSQQTDSDGSDAEEAESDEVESGEEENGEGEEETDQDEAGSVDTDETPSDEDGSDDSENGQEKETVSENTLQVKVYAETDTEEQPWKITYLQEENDCIFSADAGRTNGRTGYAYAAGTLDGQYNVLHSKVAFIAQDGEASTLEDGVPEKVEFTSVYFGETLTWYQNGDIHYFDENGDAAALFNDTLLPSSSYTLLSDGTGSPEVIFPVNADGKANLYRIGYENGAFLPALPITDQEDYIQYADGFISDGRTMLVYNRMEVNEKLEEVNNSLCMGTLEHSYYDLAVQSVGSMVRQDEETGDDVLEITALLCNNGTINADQLNLSLAKADGTILATVPIDTVLESGETGYGTAVFSPDNITEEAEYTVTVSGATESNMNNNSSRVVLGGASLQVNAEIIAVAGTRTMHVGIRNTGVTACGGTVSVRDMETGTEYCSSDFESIAIGQTVFAEVEIDLAVFDGKDVVVLEAVVTPDAEDLEAVSDFVTVYAPTYAVTFVTDTEESTVYVGHGKTVDFPKNPMKEGVHFTGWYNTENSESGTLYTEETPIKEDVILYARFAQEESSIPMENCSVSTIPTQLYTGKAIKPAVTVKWGSEVLNAKKDYTVSYQNNKEQGKATVTITGKGKYTGSITRSFMIMYPISKVSVSKIPAVNFTGETHTPDVTVTYQKKVLVKNKDYTVTYTNNRNAGTAGITITGKGKYAGTKTVTFQIKGTGIAGMVFEKIPDVTYNPNGSRPIVTVKTKGGVQLRAGADYRLAYENTVNKGIATVTVIGNGNYTGTKKLTYKILAKPLIEAMLSEIEEAVYTGSPIKPDITVTDGSTQLEQGRDYTVSYTKNASVGTATMTVKGKGNYAGTVKVPFTIQPVNMENNPQIRIRVSDMAYTGKAVRPTVQVYMGEKKLSTGSYTLSYADNTEKGTAVITVTGKGNYTGTISANFRIVDKAKLISSLKIDKISDVTYTGSAVEPEVQITDGTYQLIKGVDFEITYRNQYNAGKATVTITGIGSYAGCKDITYKINRRAIANKNILEEGFVIEQVPDENYTGYALKPDVIIKDRGKLLELGRDYKLSYKKNTKIGTASIILSGIGNYSGSINTITFGITGWDYNSLQAEISDQIYTGKALKPQVIFRYNGTPVELKAGTAVKITYADNKNAGTATAVITGKGELKNMNPITVTFEIGQADITDAIVGKIPNQTLKGIAVKPIPKVKVGRNTLKAGRDFTVSYLRNGVKGEAEMIITGIGNYTGSCRKTFIVQ